MRLIMCRIFLKLALSAILMPFIFAVPSIQSQPATNCAPRPPGLIAWWPGEGVPFDVVGTNHGTLQNGATYGPSVTGQGFRLDGTNDYISLPEDPATDLSRMPVWTIEAWVTPTSLTNKTWPTIYSEGRWGISMGLQATNGFPENWILTNATGSSVFRGYIRLTNNQPSHVALVNDGATLTFYVNGAFAGSTNTPTILPNANGAAIGAVVQNGGSAPNSFLAGTIDEVSLYNRALDSNEVFAIWQAGSAGKCYTNDAAPVFLAHPTGQTTVEQRTATLTGLAMGTPRPDYQWLFNGSPLANATNNNLILTNLAPAQSGDYALVATNLFGSATSAVAQLTVLVDSNLPGRDATNCTPKPNNVVSWWPCDGTTFDVVGALHGSSSGAIYSSGKAGQALTFDGQNDFVSVPDSTALSPHIGPDGEMSLEAWVRVPSLPSSAGQGRTAIVAKGNSSQWEYALYVRSAGTFQFDVWNLGGTGYGGASGGTVQLNTWHHLVGTLKKGSFTRLYVDGTLAAETAIFSGDTADGTSALYFGRRGDGQYFRGTVDEVSLYSRNLSSAEIASLYAAGSAGKCFTNDPAPLFVQHPQSQTNSLLGSVTLNGAAMGTPRPQYQWLFNGSSIPGGTNATLIMNNLETAQGGNYVLVASNVLAVTQSDAATLTVLPYVLFGAATTISSSNTNYEHRDIVVTDAIVTIDGAHEFNSLFLTNGATLRHTPANTSGLRLTVSTDCMISSDSSVNLDGLGYGSYAGPGRGAPSTPCNQSTRGAGGAGHGAQGGNGNVNGGAPYGFLNEPQHLGSGGGYTTFHTGVVGCDDVSGGAGGGLLILNVGGTLALDGSIRANGLNGGTASIFPVRFSGGGGSGGTIHITAGGFAGKGSLFVNGGNGGYSEAGGGAGGRIALHAADFAYTGVISVRGGSGRNAGGAGTVYSTPRVLPSPESFESGWSGWWQDSTLWSVRRPGNGPVSAHTGTNAICGNAGANYGAGSRSRLVSPGFIVPSVSGDTRVILRWWQWYQYGAGDTGVVQIGSALDTNWTTIAVAATSGTSAGWTIETVDLSPYQGQELHVGFLHSANGDGSVGAGWFIDDVSLSQATPTRLTLDVPSSQQFTANGQSRYFVVSVPAGGHLRVLLDSLANLGINELYVRRGALPSPGAYDFRYNVNGGADQSIFVPNAGAGDWFILAYNDSGPVPGDYTLEVEFKTSVILERLAPARVGNSVPGAITIHGAAFTPSDTAALVGGGTYPAMAVSFVSASELVADFNFPLVPTNTYQLTVTSGTNSDALPFTVTDGGTPKLVVSINAPRVMGYHAVATIWVDYRNAGQVAMPAPVLTVSCTLRGQEGAFLTLDSSRLKRGFWTSATPEGFAHSVQFLASGATPGVLQPGESRRVPVYYAGWRSDRWDFSYPPIISHLHVLSATNSTSVDWPALKADMKPSTVSDEAWDAIFANFTNQIGGTWGDYVRMLNDNAGYLARLGENVNDIGQLLGFEVQQASGLGAVRTLASAIDAQVAAPGPALIFRRSFSTDIADRYRLARLGRGWSDNWDIALTNAPDGTVTVLGPGRSRRVFQPDSRTTNNPALTQYFSPAGDTASLTNLPSGGRLLRESDGTRSAFRADGKLDYVEDTHGTRIAAVYSGNQLTRLEHSTGPFLQFSYDGDRIGSITDSLGRTTIFDYNGEHLSSAIDYRRMTNTYAYAAGQGAAREHALTGVTTPDGVRQTYTYDTFGRLASRAGCCGSLEQTTYAYPSGGLVTVTDSLTNTTKNYFDHRGLLVRTEGPLGNVTQRTFDDTGFLTRITDPAGRTRAFGYDNRGNRIAETDELGYTTRFIHGLGLNKLINLIDANGNVTTYTYEPDGDLASIIYADGSRESWTNDSRGNRVSWTNRRSQTIRYTNDLAGRVTERVYPDGALVTFRYDARGNLTNFTDATGSTTQEFDTNDRLTRIIYPGNRILSYTYDTGGRRKSMTNELGHRTEYHYDDRGRLWYLTDERGSNIVTYAYDEAGRLKLKTLGNGVYTTYSYDPAGQLLDLHNRKPDGSTLSRFQYCYDSRGRRTIMTTSYGPSDPRASIAGLWRYDYDDYGQLIGWTAPDGGRVDHRYDKLGNRTNVMDNGIVTSYEVNNLNQYTRAGSAVLRYDADGNLTNRVTPEEITTFTWSAENKLLRVVAPMLDWENHYDATGNRTRVVDAGVTRSFSFDPIGSTAVFGEYAAGGLIASFNYGGDLVSRRDQEGGIAFYTFDGISSVSELTLLSHIVAAAYAYLPFGELAAISPNFAERFRFVGGFGLIADTPSLVQMGARFYDSSIGRFLSMDPLGIMSGEANWYRYAANSPVVQIDPLGLQPIPAGWSGQNDMWCSGHRMFCEALANQFWPPFVPNPCAEYERRCKGGGGNDGGGGDEGGDSGGFLCDRFPWLPWCDPDDSDDSDNSDSRDPNELIGPRGYGSRNFVRADSLLPYTIHFENATNATAPAQQVFITDRLTNLLDWQTFELTEIAFGDVFLAVPPGTRHFEKTVPMRFNGVDFEVQVEAGIRLASGEVYATFRSIIPTTGLPPGVETGFLPPENGTGRGQGHIGYVIRAQTNLTTGTEIRNVAFITFDIQPAIRTDQVDPQNPALGIDTNKQALVTIDAEGPVSMVTGPSGTANSAKFQVCWFGSDIGSGIAGYDVYVSTNGVTWTLWLANTATNCAIFLGANDATYYFHTVARDNTGHVEPVPTTADVMVITPPNSPPELAPVPDYVMSVNQTLAVTNVAADPDVPAQTLRFSLAEAPSGASINEQSGVFRWTPTCGQGNSTNRISIRVTDNGLPVNLSATQTFLVTVRECVEVSLGNAVMLAGTSNAVSIRLLSTVELTNLAFTVSYPASRFTNFSLVVDTQQVSAPLLIESNGRVQIELTLPASRILYGPTNVGELGFTAQAGQSSAFVPLLITDIDGLKPNEQPVANAFGQPGRVTVVGTEPLLEALPSTNGHVRLIVYDSPGAPVRLETTTVLLTSPSWVAWTNLAATTNLWRVIEPVRATNHTLFIRALRD